MNREEALNAMQQRTAHLTPSAWAEAWRKFCLSPQQQARAAIDRHKAATGNKPLEWSGIGLPPRPGQLLDLHNAAIRRTLLAQLDLWQNARDELYWNTLKRELSDKPRWASLSAEQQEAERAANHRFLAWSIPDLMDDDGD